LQEQTKLPVLAAILGQAEALLPGSQRLSSSKGQTRRKTATQSHGPSLSGADIAHVRTRKVAWLPKG